MPRGEVSQVSLGVQIHYCVLRDLCDGIMKKEKLSKAAASGAVALIFLVLGFQAAIFTGNVFRSGRDHRVDTVYIAPPGPVGEGQVCEDEHQSKVSAGRSKACPQPEPDQAITGSDSFIQRGQAPKQEYGYSDSRRAISEKLKKKPEPETFPFDPNTVTHEELVRLGFSERQAQVIENYRAKGGKYYSPSDFAKMYVVDSAAYARLKPYIHITKLDLNTADSLHLISLRGIGPYYAHKILEYRRKLGGVFTSKEQLLEIEGFDSDRLAGFAKGVETRPKTPRFTLWDADRSQLAAHPYIGSYAAKGILRYKSVADTADWSIDKLVENGVLTPDAADRLRYLDGRRQGNDE